MAKAAKKYGKKVIAFSGCVVEDAVLCNGEGIDAFFPTLRAVDSLEEAMRTDTAMTSLKSTVEQCLD